MALKDTVRSIASQVSIKVEADMTVTEKNIARMLEQAGYLRKTEYGWVRRRVDAGGAR